MKVKPSRKSVLPVGIGAGFGSGAAAPRAGVPFPMRIVSSNRHLLYVLIVGLLLVLTASRAPIRFVQGAAGHSGHRENQGPAGGDPGRAGTTFTTQTSGSLPEGFSIAPYADGLTLPVDMEFLPDGGILVAEKGLGLAENAVAHIRLVRDQIIQAAPVLSLSTNAQGDSGLNGLAVDPDFAQNGYFYIWHATGNGSTGWSGQSVFRLSRFTFDPLTSTADPGSEVIVLDGVPWGQFHNGGGLAFGSDGFLYLATGDTFRYFPSQELDDLRGKLLRIRPTDSGYDIPADNPFAGVPGARDEIYAYGLRNPFRISLRTSDGLIYIADVGESTWEEMSAAQAAANFGWSLREGPCPVGQLLPCSPAPAGFTDPVLYYPHPAPSVGSAISALAFYEGTAYPALYQDMVFFADINQGWLKSASLADPPVEETAFITFMANAGGLVDLAYHDQALYMLDIFSGQILKLTYFGEGVPPTAKLDLDNDLGSAPLTVTLSGTGSFSPGGGALLYEFDFGDGSPLLSTGSPVVTHTYATDGNYTPQLVVEDPDGLHSAPASAALTVYSGEMPVIELENLSEAGRTAFYAGDTFQHTAIRSTTADLDPDAPFTWRIDLHHNQHAHPIVAGNVTAQDVFTIPKDDHGGDFNLWYRFYLTMRTDQGIEVTISSEIFPALSETTLESVPPLGSRAWVELNHVDRTLPYTFTSIVGTEFQAIAMETVFTNDSIYVFDHWDGQATPDPVLHFEAPVQDATFQVHYLFAGPVQRANLPMVSSGNFIQQRQIEYLTR